MKRFLKESNIKLISFFVLLLVIVPVFVFAQSTSVGGVGNGTGLAGFINNITSIIKTSVVGLLFTVAFLFFFYGVVQYTINPSEEAKDKGRGYMTWGLIGLTVMFSVYGLINVLQNTFFSNTDMAPIQPTQIK